MAEQASCRNVKPRTIKLTAAAVGSGLRVTRDASGACSVSPKTERGDFVTLADGAAGEYVLATNSNAGCKVPAIASEETLIADVAYSAPDGKFSKTATGAVVMGRWTQAASGDGVLGEVLLQD